MGGFQIWSQNWNQITFDPLSAKTLSKTTTNWQNSQICRISTAFWPKRVSNIARFKHFRLKHCRKRPKNGKIAKFAWFRLFFPKRGSDIVRFKFWDQICNPLILVKPHEFKMKVNWQLYFLTPYSTSKSSTNWRPSLRLTDQAQISYTVLWYDEATSETLTPNTFQRSVFRSTLRRFRSTIHVQPHWVRYDIALPCSLAFEISVEHQYLVTSPGYDDKRTMERKEKYWHLLRRSKVIYISGGRPGMMISNYLLCFAARILNNWR